MFQLSHSHKCISSIYYLAVIEQIFHLNIISATTKGVQWPIYTCCSISAAPSLSEEELENLLLFPVINLYPSNIDIS